MSFPPPSTPPLSSQVVTEELGIKMEKLELTNLGGAKKVTVTKDDTIVLHGRGKYFPAVVCVCVCACVCVCYSSVIILDDPNTKPASHLCCSRFTTLVLDSHV